MSADIASTVLTAPPEEIAEILAPHPLFARFDRASLLAVAEQCGFATYPAGATIMREGDPGNFALVILEGEVDIFVELPAGQVHMATIGRNRVIGELGVFTDMSRSATVIARATTSSRAASGSDRSRVTARERSATSGARHSAGRDEPLACLPDLRSGSAQPR